MSSAENFTQSDKSQWQRNQKMTMNLILKHYDLIVLSPFNRILEDAKSQEKCNFKI